MNTLILIVALVGQFDQIGSPDAEFANINFDQLGTVPLILQPTKLSEPTRGPLVFGYTKPRCPPCDTLKVEKDRLNSPHIELKDAPAWTSGHDFPVMHWETPQLDANGKPLWKSIDGWPGAGKFLTLYDESMKARQVVQQAAPQVVQQQIRRGYPVRGGWWTGCSSWHHLASGEHAGKFDHNWLASLSNAEVQSLHSDDHEGRVHWNYVVRPTQYTQTYQPQEETRPRRRGLFGIFGSRS